MRRFFFVDTKVPLNIVVRTSLYAKTPT